MQQLVMAMTMVALLIPGIGVSAKEMPTGSGLLDGMIFAGKMGPASHPDFDEELHFNEGMMWSKTCISCGYMPGPYWTRRQGDTIQFTGELKGRSGSTFHYEGAVTGGRAEVAVRWTKDRWYWSIERNLIFHGLRQDDRSPTTVAEARRMAEDALLKPLADWCP